MVGTGVLVYLGLKTIKEIYDNWNSPSLPLPPPKEVVYQVQKDIAKLSVEAKIKKSGDGYEIIQNSINF